MNWIKWHGTVLKFGDKIAVDLDCCCEPGCCEGVLIASESAGIPPTVGTMLRATLIDDTTGCFAIGSTMLMSDQISNTIWESDWDGTNPYFFGYPGWKPLLLSCGNDGGDPPLPKLGLHWRQNSFFCPSVDWDPGGQWQWVQYSGQCIPFEFIFRSQIDEVDPAGIDPGCNCAGGNEIPGTVQGLVTVRITFA